MTRRTAGKPTRIVVLNQHGDNRGDEAAMRAMVRGVGDRLRSPEFTIIHQFGDQKSEVPLAYPTTYLSLRLPLLEYVRLSAFGLAQVLGIEHSQILGRQGRPISAAIRNADLVLSAPGGPYFGDIYSGHELVHWLVVWIAHNADRPLMLYAPSCGPFRHRLLNRVRRRGFGWFDSITLREARSAELLRQLTGLSATVTADSALQDVVTPTRRNIYAAEDETLLVMAVRDPGRDQRERHDQSVLAAIERICERAPTSVVFLPQLHSPARRDAPYLAELADRVTSARHVTVASETLDSTAQRAIVAAADLVISGRYHPTVFAIASAVPVLVIAYEHKMTGVAEAAGIASWVTPVCDLDPKQLADQAQSLMDCGPDVRPALRQAADRLRVLSGESSAIATRLLRGLK